MTVIPGHENPQASGWTVQNAYTAVSVPSGNVITSSKVPLKRIHAALSGLDSAPAFWLPMGDSITEAAGASKSDNGYVSLTRAALQKKFTRAGKGGFGFLNTSSKTGTGSPNANLNGVGAGVNYWTFSGAAEGGHTGDATGLLGTRRHPFVANETATLNFTGTGFDLHYTLGSSSFTYAVDGNAAVSVTVGAGTAKTGKTSVTGLSSAPHTVVVTPVAAGTLVLHGAMLYDGDEAAGLRVLNDGVFGISTSGYVPATGAGGSTYLTDPLALWPNPALVTIHLGTNNPANSVSTTQTTTDLQTLIANVKAKCTITPSFVLMTPAVTNFNSTYATPWASYVSAIKAVVDADPTNVLGLDLSLDFIDAPSSANNYAQGLFSTDNTHPKDAGHRLIAQRLVQAIVGDLAPLN